MASHPIGFDMICEWLGVEKTEEATQEAFFRRITEIFEKYMRAARAIVASPHHEFVAQRQVMGARKVRGSDANQRNYLAKHPEYVSKSADRLAAAKGLAVRKRFTYDTTENRFIKFILLSTANRLETFEKRYAESSENADKEIIEKISAMIASVKGVIPSSFLENVSAYEAKQSSRHAPNLPSAYRALYQCHRMLEHGLILYFDVPFFDDFENQLSQMDWSHRDVLVGSFRRTEQFAINLRDRYYYVPAERLAEDRLPIRYVALYQSATLFGGNAGIRYYGEVLATAKVRRGRIPVPMSRNNGNEPYCVFRVREWKELPMPITVKGEGVNEPRFTNMFLLTHCAHSYELFHVHSAEQFRLLTALKRMSDSHGDSAPYRIDQKHSLLLGNGTFELLNEERGSLLRFKVSEFKRYPRYYFSLLKEKLK